MPSPVRLMTYIGRAMPRYRLARGRWANPYRIGEDGDREEVLRKYEEAARHWLSVPSEAAVLREEMAALEGLTLACWCSPRDGTPLTTDDPTICHGQILLRIAQEITRAASWELAGSGFARTSPTSHEGAKESPAGEKTHQD